MMQDFAKRLSDVTDGIALTKEELKLLGIDNKNDLLPQIKVNGKSIY